MTAVAPPFQAAMVPSSVTKMNFAAVLPGKAKPAVPLATTPVGAECWLTPEGTGIVTLSAFVPAPLYTVAKPVPLSEIHHGLPALRVNPHELTSWVSCPFVGFVPTFGMLETKSVLVYCWANTADRTNTDNSESATSNLHFFL